MQRALSGKPFVLGGSSMLYGYLQAAVNHRAKLVTAQEEALYRKVLNQRIFGKAGSPGFCSTGTTGLPGKA
jgi:hypothetical protein